MILGITYTMQRNRTKNYKVQPHSQEASTFHLHQQGNSQPSEGARRNPAWLSIPAKASVASSQDINRSLPLQAPNSTSGTGIHLIKTTTVTHDPVNPALSSCSKDAIHSVPSWFCALRQHPPDVCQAGCTVQPSAPATNTSEKGHLPVPAAERHTLGNSVPWPQLRADRQALQKKR